MPRQYSFRSTMVLRVREGNLYRMRGQPMRYVASSSRETYEEEKVSPPVVRHATPPIENIQKEQVAPPVVQA
jgi:hypothetical protein